MDYSNPYAVYGRTSKDTDDAFSVSSQIDAGVNFAKNNDFYVPEEFLFREDFTGKAFDRPEYDKIRRLVKAHKIKGLIIYATDRFARRVSVGEMYLDELFDNGVTLYNVSWGNALRDTPEDRLRFNFETTFSSFERDKIVERTTRGRVKKAECGRLPGQGRQPWGYTMNEYKNNLIPTKFAPYVKEIMDGYGWDHIGVSEIANMLNARGIPTPGMIRSEDLQKFAKLQLDAQLITREQYDKKMAHAARMYGTGMWNKTIVHAVLDNVDVYAGDYLVYVRGTPYHVEVPPIISIETAEAVKKMIEVGRKRQARFSKSGSDDFLMARRLTCKDDGYAFGARVKHHAKNYHGYYTCQCVQMGKKCPNKIIRDDVFDELTRNFLRNLLLNPDRLFAWWEEQNRNDESSNENVHEEITQVQDHITETKNKLFRTLDRLTDKLDEFDRAYYEQQREALKRMVKEYEEREHELLKKLVVSKVNPQIIRTIADMGEQYKEVLNTSTDIKFWRGIVDDLDLTGEIGTDEQGEYVDFVLFEEKKMRRYIGSIESDHSNLIIMSPSFRPC